MSRERAWGKHKVRATPSEKRNRFLTRSGLLIAVCAPVLARAVFYGGPPRSRGRREVSKSERASAKQSADKTGKTGRSGRVARAPTFRCEKESKVAPPVAIVDDDAGLSGDELPDWLPEDSQATSSVMPGCRLSASLADLARQNGTATGICRFHRPDTAAAVGEMVEVPGSEGANFVFALDITD